MYMFLCNGLWYNTLIVYTAMNSSSPRAPGEGKDTPGWDTQITAGCSPLQFSGVDHVRTRSVLPLPCRAPTVMPRPSCVLPRPHPPTLVPASRAPASRWRRQSSTTSRPRRGSRGSPLGARRSRQRNLRPHAYLTQSS